METGRISASVELYSANELHHETRVPTFDYRDALYWGQSKEKELKVIGVKRARTSTGEGRQLAAILGLISR